jgi:putative AdoMet-dependent methyltransferase
LDPRDGAGTERRPWAFDEFVQASVNFSNAQEVEQYDQRQQSDAEQEAALLRRLGVSGDHTLIEFGLGTGVLAVEAAKVCRKVYAVDVSTAMLSFVETRAERLGLGNLECFTGGFLTYEHRGEPADIVVTQNALHHLPDFWKVEALLRVASMLKPGGIFYLRDVIFSFPPAESATRIEAWIDEVSSDTGDGWSREDFEGHVRDEHSTYSWLLEPMIGRTGFEIEDASYDALGAYAEYTCKKL